MKTTLNYGPILEHEINEKGYSKKTIAAHLDIATSTLDTRLQDGAFTIHQIEKLQTLRYLPYEQ